MKVAMQLKDGFSGTLSSNAANILTLRLTCPDTTINRDFMLDTLFQLQSGRDVFNANRNRERINGFAPVAYERVGGKYLIREEHYGGMPLMETLWGCRDDLRLVIRTCDALNGLHGMSNREIAELPHVDDMCLAYEILCTAVQRHLKAEIGAEDLQAAYEEAKTFFKGKPTAPRPAFVMPIIKNIIVPPDDREDPPEEKGGSSGNGGEPTLPRPPAPRILAHL